MRDSKRRHGTSKRIVAVAATFLLLAVAFGGHARADAEQYASATPAAAQPTVGGQYSVSQDVAMRMVLNPDGSVSLVPASASDSSSSGGGVSMPAGVILPGASSASGLVPLWMMEEERAAREREREEQEKQQREGEEEEQAAAEAAATAEAQAEQAAAEEQELDDEVAQLLRAATSNADAHAEAEQQARYDQPQQQQSRGESESDSPHSDSSEQQSIAEEVAAAAARAYAEQSLVAANEASSQVSTRSPADALLFALQHSSLFRELTPQVAWHFVTANRPFLLLLLCRCDADSELDIGGFERLVSERDLKHRFSFLWARDPTIDRFHMSHTYGLERGQPALIIDNIPIGQHVEKYAFAGGRGIRRPHTATAEEMVRFLQEFLRAPSTLPLILRSQPAPTEAVDLDSARGRVVEVVGSTFADLVLHSRHSILLLLYSPSCPACHTAMPVVQRLAERLAWSQPNVRVARIDRANNDVPLVLRFDAYPTLFLFRAGDKSMDSTLDGGEEAMNRGLRGSRGWRAPLRYGSGEQGDRAPSGSSCSATLSVDDIEAWVSQQLNANMLPDADDVRMERQSEQQTREQSMTHDSEAAATASAGVAM